MTLSIPNPKKVTDQEVLDLILSGQLTIYRWIDRKTPVVQHRGKVLKSSLMPGRNNPRYRVELCLPPLANCRRKRTIMLSKLVWMILNRQVVPEGCHVDHIDGNRFNDSPDNLQALTVDEHAMKHGYNPYLD